jgi:hypothetical protein
MLRFMSATTFSAPKITLPNPKSYELFTKIYQVR